MNKQINELKKYAKKQKVLGFDASAYVEAALKQMGVSE